MYCWGEQQFNMSENRMVTTTSASNQKGRLLCIRLGVLHDLRFFSLSIFCTNLLFSWSYAYIFLYINCSMPSLRLEGLAKVTELSSQQPQATPEWHASTPHAIKHFWTSSNTLISVTEVSKDTKERVSRSAGNRRWKTLPCSRSLW